MSFSHQFVNVHLSSIPTPISPSSPPPPFSAARKVLTSMPCRGYCYQDAIAKIYSCHHRQTTGNSVGLSAGLNPATCGHRRPGQTAGWNKINPSPAPARIRGRSAASPLESATNREPSKAARESLRDESVTAVILRPVATTLLMVGVLLVVGSPFRQLPISALPQSLPHHQVQTFIPRQPRCDCFFGHGSS